MLVGTLYYFGDNDREGWKELFDKYKFPPYEIPKLKPEISFGMAGRLEHYSRQESFLMNIRMTGTCVTGPGSGVAFHFHGPTFAETIYGRKVT